MNGIYISQDLTHADGILEKINLQINEFEKNGCSMTKHINGKRNKFHLIRNLLPIFSTQYFKSKNIEWNKYDFVYIRKGAVLDKSVLNIVKRAKKDNPTIKILLEIPTYPYIDEFKGVVKLDIALKEKLWTKKLHKYIDRVVTYSNDTSIFGIKCINISNAYAFSEWNEYLYKSNESINLLGVATLCFYHGYDRVIEGMREYYLKDDTKTKITFTLVGDGPVLKKYQQMITEYNLEEVIHLEGRKKISELPNYYKKADIGVDSLARHRSGVTYNSSLKGKEYLANGLPIISGVETDLDSMNPFFYYRVASNDEPIDITSVIAWYNDIIEENSKANLSKEIYSYGIENFTFEKTFSPVVDYLRGEVI